MITFGLSTSGCSSLLSSFNGQVDEVKSDALLQVVAKASQQELDELRKSEPDVFSVAAVKVEPPRTLVLTLRFKHQLPKKLLGSTASLKKDMGKQAKALLKELEAGGIKKPAVRIVMLNADGTKIMNKRYKA